METEGWDKIMIETNQEYEDEAQMYAAGYLEGSIFSFLCSSKSGYLSRTAIHNFYVNFLEDNFYDDEDTLSSVYQWLSKQNVWVCIQSG